MTGDNWISERMTPMKLTPEQSPLAPQMTAKTTAVAWYQVFRRTRAGIFDPCFRSDSPAIAVEAFLRQSPAFEGGEVRLWNHRPQRLSAVIQWTQVGTFFGFPVRQRVSVFYDRRLAELAREIQMREFLREMMHRPRRHPRWLVERLRPGRRCGGVVPARVASGGRNRRRWTRGKAAGVAS